MKPQRLIDADALKNDILKSAVMIDDTGIQTGYEIAIELIKRQPTVDAVPVIRCKDCIHNVANRKTDPIDITDYSGQDIVCDYFMTDGQEPDDYCSKAEPKETEK